MVTLILGKTLVFWTGILAGISLFLMLSSCSVMCKIISSRAEKRRKLHKYFVASTVIFSLIHISLGLLSNLLNIWV